MAKLLKSLQITLEMIKFEHTLFALPFAFLGAFLAARGIPSGRQFFWILVAMAGARSAAMAFNRLADQDIDGLNSRTRQRALPAGLLSRQFVVGFTLLSCAFFVLAAWQLNPLAFRLAPLAIAIFLFYSITKRFTWLAHLFLGLALACAPVGGWVAVRGTLEVAPFILGLAVALWIAGGDIIYACLDADFDSRMGLHSIPQRWGIPAALRIAVLLHLAMLGVLVYATRMFNLGWLAWGGIGLVAALLIWEHCLVGPEDFSRVNTAFFTLNAAISATLFLTTAADLLLISQR